MQLGRNPNIKFYDEEIYFYNPQFDEVNDDQIIWNDRFTTHPAEWDEGNGKYSVIY